MKPIYFEIPYNAIRINKKKFFIPKYALPAKDWQLHNNIDLNKDGAKIFTFIRNPLERVVLQYKHQLKHRNALKQYPMGFKEWCFASFKNTNVDKFIQNNPKDFLSQTEWINGLEDKIELNSCQKIVFTEKYYDSDTIELIKNFYKLDFNNFFNVYF